jgi:hypothetical protein
LEHFYIIPTRESVDERAAKTETKEEKVEIYKAWVVAHKRAEMLMDKKGTVVVSAKSISDAKDQVLKKQEEGMDVDTITFSGGHGSPGAMQFGKDDVNKKSMADFFSSDKDGKKVDIEDDGYTRFSACIVGRGKEGDAFLTHVANKSGRRAIGYTAVIQKAINPPIYIESAYGRQRYLGGYEDNGDRLGAAYKYEKHVDPGGVPVRYNNHKEPPLAYNAYPVEQNEE